MASTPGAGPDLPPDHPTGQVCSIDHMIDGIRQFKARFYEQAPGLMRTLVQEGQAPKVMMIACADSRVDPALLSGAGPGDLFVLRNIANLVPPYRPGGGPDSVGAGVEYAVLHLAVEHIVVLGHAHCGGIKAMLDIAGGGAPVGEFIGSWVEVALDAARHYVADETAGGEHRAVPVERLKTVPFLVERAAIQRSLANLAGYPWVADRMAAGRLKLHGWWFDIETGDLWATDAADGEGERLLLPVT